MRVVKYSSSVLLPSYFADRRWMRSFWSRGGRQWSTSGVLVANSWFSAWFNWSFTAFHGSTFVTSFRCVRLAPRLVLMSCEARIASVATSWCEPEIRLWKKPRKRSHRVTSKLFTCWVHYRTVWWGHISVEFLQFHHITIHCVIPILKFLSCWTKLKNTKSLA